MFNTQEIIRSFTIDFITGNPNQYIEWFESMWSNLICIETNVYHDRGGEFIYVKWDKSHPFTQNDIGDCGWIFFRDEGLGRFWVDNLRYWSVLNYDFLLPQDAIRMITKLLVEDKLNNDRVSGEYISINPKRSYVYLNDTISRILMEISKASLGNFTITHH
jgi:hypothetical protein